MESSGIVPDVIDVLPQETIQIVYPSGVSVDNGKELTPTQVKDQPTISWPSQDGQLYLLAMTDPDAPSRQNPTKREVLHYLVANIPANNLDKGDVLFEYIGSGAPEGTGLHRYVWLVFKQQGKITISQEKVSKRSRRGRLNFSIRKFAEENKLGNPIAGNFFVAQYDDYVPTHYANMTDE